jgi:hypothetical protein
MARRWDNIEILQAIDRLQSEVHGGGPLTGVAGLSLMQQIECDSRQSRLVEDAFCIQRVVARSSSPPPSHSCVGNCLDSTALTQRTAGLTSMRSRRAFGACGLRAALARRPRPRRQPTNS